MAEEYDYAGTPDLDIARHINLALLLCNGISEQDAGFDLIIGLNDAGLEAVARIIGKVRTAAAPIGDQRWLPIETAPKDRRIRLLIGGYERHGKWDDDRYAKKPRPYWRWEGSFGVAQVRTNKPTHWMETANDPALSSPPPPSDTGDDNGALEVRTFDLRRDKSAPTGGDR